MIPQLVCSKISFIYWIVSSFQFPVVTQYDNKIEKLGETYQLNILINPSATTTAQVPPTRRWRHTPLQVCDSLDSLALPCIPVYYLALPLQFRVCITMYYIALPCITYHCVAVYCIAQSCLRGSVSTILLPNIPTCFSVSPPHSRETGFLCLHLIQNFPDDS